MTDRVLNWFGRKASAYLVWLDERERRFNRDLNGPCLDCGEGPLYCYCDEAYERDQRDRSVYDEGYGDGYSEARERAWEDVA